MSTCPLPSLASENILLAHGSGGRMMHDLLNHLVLPTLGAEATAAGDSAILDIAGQRLAFTSDSFVVHPWRFPGGDIGKLAVCGTVNDLAMVGARPRWLSCSLILEEGFALENLQTVLTSLRATADAAGVQIVTGDTKVVERGHGDGIFINTAGIGVLEHPQTCLPSAICPGDAIIVSGDLGRHGIAVLASRDGLDLQVAIKSDVDCLHEPILALLAAGLEIHALRDLTRGGLASGLNELMGAAQLDAEIKIDQIPVELPVRTACDLLGFDPLSVANEGRFVAVLPQAQQEMALTILKQFAPCQNAIRIGYVGAAGSGRIYCRNAYGVAKLLIVPVGELLPRIC